MFSAGEDLRLTFRVLAKRPLASLTAIVAFAVGIGFNTAAFSSAEVLILRPLLIPDQDRVALIESQQSDNTAHPVTAAEFAAFRDAGIFQEVGAAAAWEANLTGAGDPLSVSVFRVSGRYFQLVGLSPEAGRFFGEETNPRQVVLSYHLWQDRFGNDPAVLGRDIHLNGAAYRVTGVMPKGFRYPLSADAWTPLILSPQESHDATVFQYQVLARLRPGGSLDQARAELRRVGQQLSEAYPETLRNRQPTAELLRKKVSGDLTYAYTRMTLVAVAFLLLIACANVAGLQVANATSRVREVAIRAALGASRWRLARQFLIETSVLAVAGALGGLLVGSWSMDLIKASIPPEVEQFLPGWYRVGLSPAVLAYTGLMTLVAALAAGVLPAWVLARTDAGPQLKESARTSGGTARHRLRSALVVSQVTASLVLLVGSFLMTKGFQAITLPSPNMDPERVLTFRLNLPETRYAQPEARADLQRRVLERLSALPGVREAGATSFVPYSFFNESRAMGIENRPLAPGETRPTVHFHVAGGDYWRAMNIPVLDGRTLKASDGAGSPRVAVVNQAFVERYFPGQSALGRAVHLGPDDKAENRHVIVGVVGNVMQEFIDRTPKPLVYVSYQQTPLASMDFVMRSQGDPATIVPQLRALVSSLDPELPISMVRTEAKVIRDTLSGMFNMAGMMSALGVVALFLAALGLFALVMHSVADRTRELGIRIALGASKRSVLWLVLRQAVLLVGVGFALGLPVAYALARLLAGLVYGVSPTDPAAFAGVPALLAAAALGACWWPVRRALHTDPMTALRHE